MRVLFIDDDIPATAPAKARLEREGHSCVVVGFSRLSEAITQHEPDVIVLDLMDGVSADRHGAAGKGSYATIWDSRFCPIIVYSANPDLIDDEPISGGKHPLIRKVQKGRGSEENIFSAIGAFSSCVTGLQNIRKEVDVAISHSMKDLAPLVFSSAGTGLEAAFQHMGRRRVAACLDDRGLFEETLVPWGQYIYPPLSMYPKQCDILRKASSDPADPASYQLVLTPSCDLVNTENQRPKVTQVLCACCESPGGFLAKARIGATPSAAKREDTKKRLGTVLTAGFLDEYVPLPGFLKVFSPMVANLKKLELIDYVKIGNEEEEGVDFIRIASVDSPFREQMSWAYQNAGCRPGVPDRDLNIWIDDYIKVGE